MANVPPSPAGTVERWLAWLHAGGALRIPPSFVPYQETYRATLAWLGDETFERAEEWKAFEVGHGYYVGTERTELSHDDVVTLLASLAAAGRETVVPVLPEVPADESQPLADLLPRLRAGELALRAWIAPIAQGERDVVLADGDRLLWVRLAGERLERVVQLDPAVLADPALVVPRGSLEAATGADRELAAAAGERLRREAALLAALADPGRCLRDPRSRTYTTRGVALPWLGFWDDPGHERPYVREVSEHGVRVGIASVLATEPAWCDEPMPQPLGARARESERALATLHAWLLAGEAALQRNTSVGMLWVWIDGVGCEVDVDPRGAVHAVKPVPGLRPDPGLCASIVQSGGDSEHLKVLDDALRTAVRARLAR